MVFSRRQPFHPMWNALQQLQTDMNRLFDRYGDEGQPGSNFPLVNMWEEGDDLYLTAEIPGLIFEDLEILVTGDRQLTIKGERKPAVPEKAVRHRQERGFGKFTRVLPLPFPVNADKVEARLEHGILNVKLGKHESAKPRKIPVKAAD